jgi:hypothetical protein
MQRAFTARTDREARQVPLLGGFGKLGFSLLSRCDRTDLLKSTRNRSLNQVQRILCW